MKSLFLSLLTISLASVGLLANDGENGIPPNAKKVGPATMREPGRTCYNYLLPGKTFLQDILVAKEIFQGKQLMERDLYQGIVDANGIPEETLNGVQRKWHLNGRLAAEEPYRNGIMDGTFRQWNSRGQLVAQYEMVNGTGVKRVYNDSGELIVDERYYKGALNGPAMSVTEPFGIMDIALYKDGDLSGIGASFYKDGKIKAVLWGGGPLIDYDEGGSVLGKYWRINKQALSESEYARKAAKYSTLPPHLSDAKQYKLLIPTYIFNARNRYLVLPKVKIPLEFDKAGNPVPSHYSKSVAAMKTPFDWGRILTLHIPA